MGTTAGATIRALWLALALGVPASTALPAAAAAPEARRPLAAWLAAPDGLLPVEAWEDGVDTGDLLDAGPIVAGAPRPPAAVPLSLPSGADAGAASSLLRAGFPAAPTRAPPLLSD